MTDDLYFIAIIARALQQPDTAQALQQAFAHIKSIGRQPQYRRGFVQFEGFMEVVGQHVESEYATSREQSVLRELMTELALDLFPGNDAERRAVLERIHSYTQWQQEYESLCTQISNTERSSSGWEFLIDRDGRPFATIVLEQIPHSQTVESLTPARYSVSLASGRLIWQDQLTERDLIWMAAFAGAPLDLAAATDAAQAGLTRQDTFLNGEVILRVFAGLESGRLEIAVNPPGNA